jgi:fructoselysine-6-P-deglycase FrlB-like protein
MSLGLSANAVTDPYEQIFATVKAGRSDVVVGISHTGLTAHVIEALRMARDGGARTVCITNYPDSPIAEASEFRLITSFREHRINAAVSSSQIAQLCVIDTLYFLVASSLGGSARKLADRAEDRVQKMLRVKNHSGSHAGGHAARPLPRRAVEPPIGAVVPGERAVPGSGVRHRAAPLRLRAVSAAI